MFTEDFIWNFAYDLISGLQYLHSLDIYHRDIKPQNIFYTAANIFKIGDLGASKLKSNQSDSGHIGTPLYSSPECLTSNIYNSASEIWSCGCVLYEMIIYLVIIWYHWNILSNQKT